MIGFTGGRIGGSGRRTGRGHDFGGLARYLVYGEEKPGQPAQVRVEHFWTRNLATEDPDVAARIMRAHAAQNPRVKEPVMHMGVSLAPGEHLSREQWEHVAERLLGALREDRRGRIHDPTTHQAICGVHSDGPQQHLHIALNRVGPDLGVWEGSWNYPRVEKELRALERELHLQPVQGRHQEQERFTGPRVGAEPAHSQRPGQTPWAAQLLREQGPTLAADFRNARSWADLEHRLADRGLHLQPSGRGGLVLTDGMPAHNVKLSTIDRAASGPSLERRFGIGYAAWRTEQARALDGLRERLEQWGSRPPAYGPTSRAERATERFLAQQDRRDTRTLVRLVERAYGNEAARPLHLLERHGPAALAGALRHAPEQLGTPTNTALLPRVIAAARRLDSRPEDRTAAYAWVDLRQIVHQVYGPQPVRSDQLRPSAATAARVETALRTGPDTLGTVRDPAAIPRAIAAAQRCEQLEACRLPAHQRQVDREHRELAGALILTVDRRHGAAAAHELRQALAAPDTRRVAEALPPATRRDPDVAAAAARLQASLDGRDRRLVALELDAHLRAAYARPNARAVGEGAHSGPQRFHTYSRAHGRGAALQELQTRPSTFGTVTDRAALATAIVVGWRLHAMDHQPSTSPPLPRLSNVLAQAQHAWGRTQQLNAVAERGMAPESSLREGVGAARRITERAVQAAGVVLPTGASGATGPVTQTLGSVLGVAFAPQNAARELLQLATTVGMRTLSLALPPPAMAALNAAVKPLTLAVGLAAYVGHAAIHQQDHAPSR